MLGPFLVHEGGEAGLSHTHLVFHGLGLLGLEGKEFTLTFEEAGTVIVCDLQVVLGEFILDGQLVG